MIQKTQNACKQIYGQACVFPHINESKHYNKPPALIFISLLTLA